MYTPAALLHTYYLPRFGRCFGVLAHHTALCERLRREWEARCDEADEPHVSDGFSVWLDRHGKTRVCIVRAMAAHMIDDAELVAELTALLASAATSEGASAAPEHPLA